MSRFYYWIVRFIYFLVPGLFDGLQNLFCSVEKLHNEELQKYDNDVEMGLPNDEKPEDNTIKAKKWLGWAMLIVQWTSIVFEIFWNVDEPNPNSKVAMDGYTEFIVAALLVTVIGSLLPVLAFFPIGMLYSAQNPQSRAVLTCFYFVASSFGLGECTNPSFAVYSALIGMFGSIKAVSLTLAAHPVLSTSIPDSVELFSTEHSFFELWTLFKKFFNNLHMAHMIAAVLLVLSQSLIAFIVFINIRAFCGIYQKYIEKIRARFSRDVKLSPRKKINVRRLAQQYSNPNSPISGLRKTQ